MLLGPLAAKVTITHFLVTPLFIGIRGGVSGVLYDLPTDSAIEAFLKKTPNQIHTVIIPFSLLSK